MNDEPRLSIVRACGENIEFPNDCVGDCPEVNRLHRLITNGENDGAEEFALGSLKALGAAACKHCKGPYDLSDRAPGPTYMCEISGLV